MKQFLLISQPNSYRIAPYIQAANTMGLEVLIASRGEHSLVTEVNRGLHINLDNPETALTTILDRAKLTPFAGILGSDDSTVELAAHAARALGLPHNPPRAARLSRRKDLARAHLARAGCAVPVHCLIDVNNPVEKNMAGLPWPCVLKPVNLSASRGVIRVNNEQEFASACERIKNIIAESSDPFERSHILVEQYIDGIEVAFEGFLKNGKLSTLAIFDKPDPLTGPFFEETIYVTPTSLGREHIDRVTTSVRQACEAYGFNTGPIHAELRIDHDTAWILEVAARTIGGDCARILDLDNSFNLEELTVALATGETDIDAMVARMNSEQSRGVMMIPIEKHGILRRVEGQNQARQVDGVAKVDIIVPDGHELIPLPEGKQYLGYIFAQGKTQRHVVESLKKAHKALNIVTAPVWKIAVNSS